MNHELFFSDGGLTPHFFHTHFLRRRSYPSSFHLSILWSSPGGEALLVLIVPDQWRTTTTIIIIITIFWNNNTEPWTFFQWWWSYPSLWFTFIFWEEGLTLLRFICQSPGFHQVELKDLLVFTGGGAGRAQKSPHDAGREFQWDSCWLDSFSGRCWA